MWLLQCSLVVQVLVSRAAYYHELSMKTITPPEPLAKDSFFGYSVAFQNNSIVASAPRADEDGQVFSCDLGTKNCTRMHFTINGKRDEIVCPKSKSSSACENKHHTHNFWLGATVKADNRNVFVCAPRVTGDISVFIGGFVMLGTNGQCYVKDWTSNTNFNKMPEISNLDRNINLTAHENVTDAFGWSMDIDTKGWLRVGSPALGGGRVMTYDNPREEIEPRMFTSPYPGGFHFGYSIATGVFINSGSIVAGTRKPGVAIGTPYGEDGTGKVLFYDKNMNLQDVVKDPAGVGSIFSAALCAARLDGQRGRHSLLVGAPAHFTGNKYHTGIVYIYRQQKRQNYMKISNEIEGPKKDGAFFGNAIANVGDMDHDEKDEIAIAAPYEDEGRGAVYLYAGSSLSDGKTDITWLQRLQPENLEFQNVGLSLVADKYFGNGCNGKIHDKLFIMKTVFFTFGLAIGAPAKDRVAVYNCLTMVTVNVETTVPNLQNRTDKTGFAFKLCLNVTYPPKPEIIHAEFAVRVEITHPNATLTDAIASNDYIEYVVKLDKSKNPVGCRPINVTTSENGDYEQEIQFNITAKLLNDPVNSMDFDPSRASVSAHSNLISSLSVRAAECETGTCKPKLSVKLTTSLNSPYLIGSSKTETVSVAVSNGAADTAYRPCVRVRVAGTAVRSAPPHCMFDGNSQRICQLQRPLKPNATWEVTGLQNIELGVTSLTSKSDQIQVSAEVYNRCEMTNNPDHNQTIIIKLTTDASGLKLESKTDQGKIVPFNRHDIKHGKILHHTYTITNIGEINWVDIHCDIWLYTNPYIVYNHSIQIYIGDTTRGSCELREHSKSSSDFKGLSCSLGNLFRKENLTVVVPITVLPDALEKVFEKANGTVETFLRVHAGGHEREKMELTTLVLREAKVPVWVIVVATAVGIIIVLLIAFALYECGFLRRKEKEKLENLKREVKRRSVMLQRQSMRLTESARAELRNKTYRELLDAAEIKEADEAEEARESYKDRRVNIDEASKEGTTVLNGNSPVSDLDLRVRIEKSLQKQNSTGHTSNSDKTPLCDE